MKKETVLRLIETEWQYFQQSISGLPDQALLIPRVVGIWTIRDVIAHITTWDQEALNMIPLILNGQRLPRYSAAGGIDAFNAREQAKKRGLTLSEVQRELKSTHFQLVDFLSTIPESDYISIPRLSHRIGLDTYLHYHQHAEQIIDWRKHKEAVTWLSQKESA